MNSVIFELTKKKKDTFDSANSYSGERPGDYKDKKQKLFKK